MQTSMLNFEIQRKTFHLFSLVIPLLYMFVSKVAIIILLAFLMIGVLIVDLARHYDLRVRKYVDNFFGKIMRPEEFSGSFRLSGSSFMAMGLFVTALFFSKGLAISSWLILIISDSLAAVVGTKMGKPLWNGKSLEGSCAFLVSAIFISMLVYFFVGYNTSFIVLILSSLIVTACEFYSKQISINDNLLIPIVYCFVTVILTFILGV